MIIGCPREIKAQEYRVGLTPSNVRTYIEHGHTVYIEYNAGIGAGFPDKDYQQAGAILADKKTVFTQAEMIIKVKEPLPEEFHLFHEGQILFSYLHLAIHKSLAEMLLSKNIRAIAYETIKTHLGLPCLSPMSRVAGRIAAIDAIQYVQKKYHRNELMTNKSISFSKGHILIFGGGTVGVTIAQMALGVGIEVTILESNPTRFNQLNELFEYHVTLLESTRENILHYIQHADVIIGAALTGGKKAPTLIYKHDLTHIKKDTLLIDVAINQGGCFETSRPTTFDEPTFEEEGITHSCIENIAGCVALTATQSLTATTLEYGLKLADFGVKKACLKDYALLHGLNIYDGKCTFAGVAEALNLPYTIPEVILNSKDN